MDGASPTQPPRPRSAVAVLGLAVSGLAIVAVVAVAGTALFGGPRATPTPAGPTPTPAPLALTWQKTAHGPNLRAVSRPLPLGNGLMVLTSDKAAHNVGVNAAISWRTSDGLTWTRLSPEDGGISASGQLITIDDICSDGRGGFVAGGSTSASGDTFAEPVAAIWQSADGATWRRVALPSAYGSLVWAIAARPGSIVAMGIRQYGPEPGGTPYSSRYVVWYSDDAVTWQSQELKGPYSPFTRVASVHGEFMALGAGFGAQSWTSADGRSWNRGGWLPDNFTPGGVIEFGDQIVVAGNWSDGKPVGVTSTDGQTWLHADMPFTDADINARVSDIVELEGRLVAVGTWGGGWDMMNDLPPPSGGLVWESQNGLDWRELPTGGLPGRADAAAVLGNRIVVTSDSDIYVGMSAG
jgi:hypothetical protein